MRYISNYFFIPLLSHPEIIISISITSCFSLKQECFVGAQDASVIVCSYHWTHMRQMSHIFLSPFSSFLAPRAPPALSMPLLFSLLSSVRVFLLSEEFNFLIFKSIGHKSMKTMGLPKSCFHKKQDSVISHTLLQ